VELLKQRRPNMLVECLTPDFRGHKDLIEQVKTGAAHVLLSVVGGDHSAEACVL
jgi:lipoate synthase